MEGILQRTGWGWLLLFAEKARRAIYGEEAAKADERRIWEMMEDYGTAIKRLCVMLLRDRQAAEEAAQDTFVKAYFHLRDFSGTTEAARRAWLSRIAVNTCRDMLRRQKRRLRTISLDALPIEPTASGEDGALTEAIAALPQAYREVVLLRYYQGLGLDDIGRALGCSHSAASRRLDKAHALLRAEMEARQ